MSDPRSSGQPAPSRAGHAPASEYPFDLALLARLEEERIARGCASVAPRSEAFAGGMMFRGEPGTWINFAAGCGLDGPASEAELDAMEQFYTSAGIEPRVEVSPYVHAGFLAQLRARGFVLHGFETLLFRPLRDGDVFPTPVAPPAGLRIERVRPDDAEQVRLWAQVSVAGFTPAGQTPREDDLQLAQRMALAPECFAYLARLDGQPAGAGAMEVRTLSRGTIAALFAYSTLGAFRGRGVQQAMIAHRLREARAHGAIVATIGSRPGMATERNVRRMGFGVGYSRAALIKPGVGPDGAPLVTVA